MATKRSSTKKTTAKKAAKTFTVQLTKPNLCAMKCLARYRECLKKGGSKMQCVAKLIDCVDGCSDV
jgi:hypothetical protein